jgi:hypothetical protein
LPDAGVIADLTGRGRVLGTDVDDGARGQEERKIGPDADESAGGCGRVAIETSEALSSITRLHGTDDL